MIFKRKDTDNAITEINTNSTHNALTIETKRLLEQMQNGNLNIRFNLENSNSKEACNNINKILDLVQNSGDDINVRYKELVKKTTDNSTLQQKQIEDLSSKLIFANKIAKIGLWEMNVVGGDPVNPNNTFIWTEDFRNVLGFSDEKEFPNVLGSWGDRIHPDDSQRVYGAFSDHMTDFSGKTPFNVKYKIKLKNGEYRWVHSQGETIRDNLGAPIKVVGSIRDINSEKSKEELDLELALKIKNFSESMKEMVSSIESITATAQELADFQESTMKLSQEIKTSADNTQKITEFIKSISSQTNLLGLNASIEAARSGNAGIGFNVVAIEIRKLSVSSSSAVDQIGNSLKDMHNSIENIVLNIQKINEITQSQAATTEEVNACVEEISATAEQLVVMVKNI
jgi:PAS domain S-box-containing protein